MTLKKPLNFLAVAKADQYTAGAAAPFLCFKQKIASRESVIYSIIRYGKASGIPLTIVDRRKCKVHVRVFMHPCKISQVY